MGSNFGVKAKDPKFNLFIANFFKLICQKEKKQLDEEVKNSNMESVASKYKQNAAVKRKNPLKLTDDEDDDVHGDIPRGNCFGMLSAFYIKIVNLNRVIRTILGRKIEYYLVISCEVTIIHMNLNLFAFKM